MDKTQELGIPYKFVTVAEVSINNGEHLAVDTETDGLYGPIMLVQLYQKSWECVKLILKPDTVDLVQLIGIINKAPKSNIVFHNASYDLSCVQDQTKYKWRPKYIQDTLYLTRLAYPLQKKFSLDKCMVYALKENPYRKAGLIKKEQQNTDWSEALDDQQIEYACIDVYYLLKLYDIVKTVANTTSYRLDVKTLRYMLSWQRNGVPVEPTLLDNARQELQEKIAAIDLPETLNINSYQQVRAYLGVEESDKLALKTFKCEGNVEAGKIVDKRTLIKRLSFIKEYSRSYHNGRPSGIVAPSALSGRTTCKEINLQQWPRKLKKIIGLPEESGRVLIYSDFDGLEMRCMAARIYERALIKILHEGHSPHDYVANLQFGPGFSNKLRQVAKMMNFLLLYGGGVAMLRGKLIQDVELLYTFDEVSEFKKGWLTVFPDIARWHKQGFRDHKAKRAWRTPFGRVYLGNLGTDHLNIQIQGMGAEVAKLAMLYIERDLTKTGLDEHIKMVRFMHDDYMLETDNYAEYYEAGAEIVGDAMAEAWRVMMRCKDIKAPHVEMPVSVDVGLNLATIDNTGSIFNYKTIGKL